jgi:hypothetical protein
VLIALALGCRDDGLNANPSTNVAKSESLGAASDAEEAVEYILFESGDLCVRMRKRPFKGVLAEVSFEPIEPTLVLVLWKGRRIAAIQTEIVEFGDLNPLVYPTEYGGILLLSYCALPMEDWQTPKAVVRVHHIASGRCSLVFEREFLALSQHRRDRKELTVNTRYVFAGAPAASGSAPVLVELRQEWWEWAKRSRCLKVMSSEPVGMWNPKARRFIPLDQLPDRAWPVGAQPDGGDKDG